MSADDEGASASLLGRSSPLTLDGERFTTLDWIGVVITGFETLALLLFPLVGRSFARMFADFGGELPALTKLVLTGWPPICFAIATALGLALGLRPASKLQRRRAWVVGAFVLGGLGFAACLVAMYLPVFSIAEAVRP